MGARLRFCLVSGSDEQILQIAERCKLLLENFDNPINYSLMYMPAQACGPSAAILQLIAFQSKEVFEFARVPSVVSGFLELSQTHQEPKKSLLSRLFQSKANHSVDSIEAAWDNLLRTPALAISKVASEIVGRSLCGIYSDTSCCSGLLQFDQGKLTSGQVYGTDGTEVLFVFKDNLAVPSIVLLNSGYDYGQPIRQGFSERYGESFATDAFLESLDESKRFVLMEKKELLVPIRIETARS